MKIISYFALACIFFQLSTAAKKGKRAGQEKNALNEKAYARDQTKQSDGPDHNKLGNSLTPLRFNSEADTQDKNVVELEASMEEYEDHLKQKRRQEQYMKQKGKVYHEVPINFTTIGSLFVTPHPRVLNKVTISWHNLRVKSDKVRYIAQIKRTVNSTYSVPLQAPAVTARYETYRFPNKSAAYSAKIYPTIYNDINMTSGDLNVEGLTKRGFTDHTNHHIALKCFEENNYYVRSFVNHEDILNICKLMMADCKDGVLNLVRLDDIGASEEKTIVIVVDERLSHLEMERRSGSKYVIKLLEEKQTLYDVQVDNLIEHRSLLQRCRTEFELEAKDVSEVSKKKSESPVILRYTITPVIEFMGDISIRLEIFNSQAYHIILSGIRNESWSNIRWFRNETRAKLYNPQTKTFNDQICLTKQGHDIHSYRFDKCHNFQAGTDQNVIIDLETKPLK